MRTYRILYANGYSHYVDQLVQAMDVLKADYPDLYGAHGDGTEWIVNDDAIRCDRILVWRHESEAEDDPGINAIAEITVFAEHRRRNDI